MYIHIVSCNSGLCYKESSLALRCRYLRIVGLVCGGAQLAYNFVLKLEEVGFDFKRILN